MSNADLCLSQIQSMGWWRWFLNCEKRPVCSCPAWGHRHLVQMANRLLGRCARLVCKSSSQAPAAAAAIRLPPLLAGPAPVSKAKHWLWVTERLMSESTAPKDQSSLYMQTLTQLDELLEMATAPEDVLSAWAKYGKNANQAAAALTKWTQLMLKTKGKFKGRESELSDSRLQDMMNNLSQNVRKLYYKEQINL